MSNWQLTIGIDDRQSPIVNRQLAYVAAIPASDRETPSALSTATPAGRRRWRDPLSGRSFHLYFRVRFPSSHRMTELTMTSPI